MTRPGTGQPATLKELQRAGHWANQDEHRAQQAAGITRGDVMAVVEEIGDIDGVMLAWGDETQAIADVDRDDIGRVTKRIEQAGFEVLGELSPEVYATSDYAYLRVAVHGGEADR